MEELIKKIMGENYKENMTEDEIIEFMKNYGNSSSNNEKTVPLEKFINLENQLKEIKKKTQELKMSIINLKLEVCYLRLA